MRNNMRNNKTTIIKVSGFDVTMKQLGFRMFHFSTVVDGKYISACHYSRYGVAVIREEIEKTKKMLLTTGR